MHDLHDIMTDYGEEDNRTVLVTLKPNSLLAEMFHTHQLPEADQQLENTLIAIMKQATGG